MWSSNHVWNTQNRACLEIDLKTFFASSEDKHAIPNEQVKRIKELMQHKQNMVRNKTQCLEMDIPTKTSWERLQQLLNKDNANIELFWWKELETISNDLHLNQNYARPFELQDSSILCPWNEIKIMHEKTKKIIQFLQDDCKNSCLVDFQS